MREARSLLFAFATISVLQNLSRFQDHLNIVDLSLNHRVPHIVSFKNVSLNYRASNYGSFDKEETTRGLSTLLLDCDSDRDAYNKACEKTSQETTRSHDDDDDDVDIANNFSPQKSMFAPFQRVHSYTSRIQRKQPSQIFMCGYDRSHLFAHLFPEYQELLKSTIKLTRETAKQATQDDILIVGLGGYCDGWRDLKLDAGWMQQNFNGAVIWFNGEWFGPYVSLQEEQQQQSTSSSLSLLPPPRQYHFGFEQDGCQSVRMHFMAVFFLDYLLDRKDAFLFAEQRPENTGERFLLYTASNCVDFREEAFDQIALLNLSSSVHYASKCSGKRQNHTNVEKVNIPGPYTKNDIFMKQYRFCLVMENHKIEGYMTEKIILAFAAGCVPIYYGSDEVFDIFNPKAFIYYDIDNPQPALDEIVRLEHNQTAYHQIFQEPIFKNGLDTLQQYFSISDDVNPNATIKQRIRDRILYPNQHPSCNAVTSVAANT